MTLPLRYGTNGKNIFKAANYLNASILGADLSRTSLAYAKRKIEESGLKNIDFIHADILELKNLGRKFFLNKINRL